MGCQTKGADKETRLPRTRGKWWYHICTSVLRCVKGRGTLGVAHVDKINISCIARLQNLAKIKGNCARKCTFLFFQQKKGAQISDRKKCSFIGLLCCAIISKHACMVVAFWVEVC